MTATGPINVYASSNTSLAGWHPGEQLVQEKLGYREASKNQWSQIRNYLDGEHRLFHCSRLHFLPIATREAGETGRVWSTILTSAQGLGPVKGWIRSPTPEELVIEAEALEGDPAISNIVSGGENVLLAGLGLEVSTRRRNKFAGRVSCGSQGAGKLVIELQVNEALGNCPKYINVRKLEHCPRNPPKPSYSRLNLKEDEPLPSNLVSFIHSSDTVFLATAVFPGAAQPPHLPHLGVNHRGGLPGFCRASTEPGRRTAIYLPDYSGNRLMSSLGNIAVTPKAGLSFPDFRTGSVLYVTGEAENLFGEAAEKEMPRIKCLTRVLVTGAVFIPGALPFRAAEVEPSLYSPPVRYLASELETAQAVSLTSGADLKLVDISLHPGRDQEPSAASVASLTFQVRAQNGTRLAWKPGQYAVVDLKSLVGPARYQHMGWPGEERTLNDDGIRTWTISSPPPAHGSEEPVDLRITIRHHPKGAMTSKLFSLAHALHLRGMSVAPLGIQLKLLGVGGGFTLPPVADLGKGVVFLAGGIGITPALAFISWLRVQHAEPPVTFALCVSCKAVDVPCFIHLINEAASGSDQRNLNLTVHFFSKAGDASFPDSTPPFPVTLQQGRLSSDLLDDGVRQMLLDGALAYVCGPPAFEGAAAGMLKALGVAEGDVRRESFSF